MAKSIAYSVAERCTHDPQGLKNRLWSAFSARGNRRLLASRRSERPGVVCYGTGRPPSFKEESKEATTPARDSIQSLN